MPQRKCEQSRLDELLLGSSTMLDVHQGILIGDSPKAASASHSSAPSNEGRHFPAITNSFL